MQEYQDWQRKQRRRRFLEAIAAWLVLIFGVVGASFLIYLALVGFLFVAGPR